MKSSPSNIIKAHYATYVNASNDDKPRRQDHAVFEGLTIVVLAGCYVVKLSTAASTALLTVSGLLSAFLFTVMLQISQRAMEWSAEGPPRGPETSSHAIGLGLGAHMALVLSIVMNRAFGVTENRLTGARTSTNVTPIEQRRKIG